MSLILTRPPNSSDWRRIRELCCLTGNAGEPIDPERWPFFSELWIGPYERLVPGWAFVSERDGAVQGYLTACPDSRRLKRRKALLFTPWLLARIALGRYARNADTRRFVRRAFRLDRGPDETFRADVRNRLLAEFPAHLHMNVDARYRGAGLGHELIQACFSRLRAEGISGIHLFCGPGPRAFYKRHGFTEIARLEFRPGVWVYALGAKP